VLHFVIIQRTIRTPYDYKICTPFLSRCFLAGEFDPPAADYETVSLRVRASESRLNILSILDGIRRNIMRVKRGFKARKRRKKVLKLAKGFRGGRSKLFRTAADAVDKALMYAYRDRRARKRDFRRLWIARINAATRMNNLSYSKFIHGLKLADVRLDRKVLAELAVSDPSGFSKIASLASQQV